MTNRGFDSEMAQAGIFDVNSSPFGGANRAFVRYCSSDLWSGDIAASHATFGFTFRGARIVAAVISSLMRDEGMGSTPGQSLLLGGCSAGAIGAMNNLDAVAAMVPAGMQVSGLFDGGALLDIRPAGYGWSNSLVPLQTQVADMVAVLQPTLAASCTAVYSGAASWKCLFGQYRLPLVKTPFFAQVPQLDAYQLMYDTDNSEPTTPAQLAFVAAFQAKTQALLAALPAGTGVFSPTCLVHCLACETSYNSILVNNMSLGTALDAWYFSSAPTQEVSACLGWPCIDTCGATDEGVPCTMCVALGGYASVAADATFVQGRSVQVGDRHLPRPGVPKRHHARALHGASRRAHSGRHQRPSPCHPALPPPSALSLLLPLQMDRHRRSRTGSSAYVSPRGGRGGGEACRSSGGGCLRDERCAQRGGCSGDYGQVTAWPPDVRGDGSGGGGGGGSGRGTCGAQGEGGRRGSAATAAPKAWVCGGGKGTALMVEWKRAAKKSRPHRALPSRPTKDPLQ